MGFGPGPPNKFLWFRVAGVYPQVVGKGARLSRRFDVARSPTLAQYSKFLGLLTPRRPDRRRAEAALWRAAKAEGRAPRSRQLADALHDVVAVNSLRIVAA